MSNIFDDLRRVFAPEVLLPGAFLEKREATDLVLDVRSAAEFAAGHLSGALNIDVSDADFRARVSELELSAPIYLYCQSGSRSATALRIIRSVGASHAENIGGIAALIRAGAAAEITPPPS